MAVGAPPPPGHLVLARILLAEGRTGSLIKAGALRALALAALGEDVDAVAALTGALTLACPQGYVRVFADEGPPMAALLHQLVAAQRSSQDAARVELGCLARLLRPVGAEHAVPDRGRGSPRCQAWPRH